MPATPAVVYEDEISLRGMIETLWVRRSFILVVTALATLVAGGAALTVNKKYSASTTIASVDDTGMGGTGGTGSLGGLAALAGVSGMGDSKKSESLAVLQSQALTEDYIRENNLLPILYSKLWNPEAKKWNVDGPNQLPTLWKANLFFKTKVRSLAIEKTGLVTLTVEWQDPKLAAKWANGLVHMANDYMRRQAIQESQRRIAYLTDQAAKTESVAVRESLYELVQDEISKATVAQGKEEYALKVLDPAIPPDVPSYPKLPLWLLMGFTSGFMTAVLVVFIRSSWRPA